MTKKTLTIAFDPGATTGLAAVASDGVVIATLAVPISSLESIVRFVVWIEPARVVVESGPQFQHHSPVTKSAEATILDVFPDAVLVPPNQWKGHPASQSHGVSADVTRHEKDAVCLARWFQSKEQASARGDFP